MISAFYTFLSQSLLFLCVKNDIGPSDRLIDRKTDRNSSSSASERVSFALFPAPMRMILSAIRYGEMSENDLMRWRGDESSSAGAGDG